MQVRMHSSLVGGLPCSKQVPSTVRVCRISSIAPQITRPRKCEMPLHSNPSRKMMSSTLVSPRAAVEEATLSDNGDSEAAALANLRTVVFSGKRYVHDFLEGPLCQVFPKATFVEERLGPKTAALAQGADAVILFVNDDCSAEAVAGLAKAGVKVIAMRCAGYDRVDLAACAEAGIRVVRVPTYSPQSVAEHAVALMFGLNRSLHQAHTRVNQGNYGLDGLVGSEMWKKTVGVVGTGAIGVEACRITQGIGCNVLAYDIRPNPAVEALGIPYMSLDEMLPQCDIITLHCPLLPSTQHIIGKERIAAMKPGTMLINVSRGGLVDSDALFEGLESGQLGGLGMDVYEKEGTLFFEDFTMLSSKERMKTWDRRFRLLLSYPQVLVTPHSAFLTHEALKNIADTTIASLKDFALGRPLACEVKPPKA